MTVVSPPSGAGYNPYGASTAPPVYQVGKPFVVFEGNQHILEGTLPASRSVWTGAGAIM